MKVGDIMGSKQRVDCEECGTSYDRLFLLGKQGDLSVCPMCGASIEINDEGVSSYNNSEAGSADDEHPDWITWYYYKDPEYGDYSLWDKLPNDPEALTLIQEFKAPPEEKCGLEEVKRILRTYIPDAFAYKKEETPGIRCPRCFSTSFQLLPRKWSLLTGFATNRFDRVCDHCGKRF